MIFTISNNKNYNLNELLQFDNNIIIYIPDDIGSAVSFAAAKISKITPYTSSLGVYRINIPDFTSPELVKTATEDEIILDITTINYNIVGSLQSLYIKHIYRAIVSECINNKKIPPRLDEIEYSFCGNSFPCLPTKYAVSYETYRFHMRYLWKAIIEILYKDTNYYFDSIIDYDKTFKVIANSNLGNLEHGISLPYEKYPTEITSSTSYSTPSKDNYLKYHPSALAVGDTNVWYLPISIDIREFNAIQPIPVLSSRGDAVATTGQRSQQINISFIFTENDINDKLRRLLTVVLASPITVLECSFIQDAIISKLLPARQIPNFVVYKHEPSSDIGTSGEFLLLSAKFNTRGGDIENSDTKKIIDLDKGNKWDDELTQEDIDKTIKQYEEYVNSISSSADIQKYLYEYSMLSYSKNGISNEDKQLAVALKSLSVSSLPGYPNCYNVQLSCEPTSVDVYGGSLEYIIDNKSLINAEIQQLIGTDEIISLFPVHTTTNPGESKVYLNYLNKYEQTQLKKYSRQYVNDIILSYSYTTDTIYDIIYKKLITVKTQIKSVVEMIGMTPESTNPRAHSVFDKIIRYTTDALYYIGVCYNAFVFPLKSTANVIQLVKKEGQDHVIHFNIKDLLFGSMTDPKNLGLNEDEYWKIYNSVFDSTEKLFMIEPKDKDSKTAWDNFKNALSNQLLTPVQLLIVIIQSYYTNKTISSFISSLEAFIELIRNIIAEVIINYKERRLVFKNNRLDVYNVIKTVRKADNTYTTFTEDEQLELVASYPATIISFSTQINNKLITIPILGQQQPMHQYLGRSSWNGSLIIQTNNPDAVKEIAIMHQQMTDMLVAKQSIEIRPEDKLRHVTISCAGNLFDILNIDNIVVSNIDYSTIENSPGITNITFNFIESSIDRLEPDVESLIQNFRITPEDYTNFFNNMITLSDEMSKVVNINPKEYNITNIDEVRNKIHDIFDKSKMSNFEYLLRKFNIEANDALKLLRNNKTDQSFNVFDVGKDIINTYKQKNIFALTGLLILKIIKLSIMHDNSTKLVDPLNKLIELQALVQMTKKLLNDPNTWQDVIHDLQKLYPNISYEFYKERALPLIEIINKIERSRFMSSYRYEALYDNLTDMYPDSVYRYIIHHPTYYLYSDPRNLKLQQVSEFYDLIYKQASVLDRYYEDNLQDVLFKYADLLKNKINSVNGIINTGIMSPVDSLFTGFDSYPGDATNINSKNMKIQNKATIDSLNKSIPDTSITNDINITEIETIINEYIDAQIDADITADLSPDALSVVISNKKLLAMNTYFNSSRQNNDKRQKSIKNISNHISNITEITIPVINTNAKHTATKIDVQYISDVSDALEFKLNNINITNVDRVNNYESEETDMEQPNQISFIPNIQSDVSELSYYANRIIHRSTLDKLRIYIIGLINMVSDEINIDKIEKKEYEETKEYEKKDFSYITSVTSDNSIQDIANTILENLNPKRKQNFKYIVLHDTGDMQNEISYHDLDAKLRNSKKFRGMPYDIYITNKRDDNGTDEKYHAYISKRITEELSAGCSTYIAYDDSNLNYNARGIHICIGKKYGDKIGIEHIDADLVNLIDKIIHALLVIKNDAVIVGHREVQLYDGGEGNNSKNMIILKCTDKTYTFYAPAHNYKDDPGYAILKHINEVFYNNVPLRINNFNSNSNYNYSIFSSNNENMNHQGLDLFKQQPTNINNKPNVIINHIIYEDGTLIDNDTAKLYKHKTNPCRVFRYTDISNNTVYNLYLNKTIVCKDNPFTKEIVIPTTLDEFLYSKNNNKEIKKIDKHTK